MKGDSRYTKSSEEIMLEWIVLLSFIGFAVWIFYGNNFVYGMINLTYWELVAINEFLNSININSNELANYVYEVSIIRKIPNLSIEDAFKVIVAGEIWTKWFHILIPIYVVCLLMKKNKLGKFNRSFKGDDLIEEMSKSLPRLIPIKHLEFGQDEKDRGAFTYPQTPFEWCVERGVITNTGNPMKNKESFDPKLCKDELIKDIESEIYRGVGKNEMDILRRFLFAVYGLWYLERYDEHNQLLDQANYWWGFKKNKDGKIEYSLKIPPDAVRLINKSCIESSQNHRVKKIINQYVFQDTVLMAMMEGINKTTTAYYIWLKSINKKLYYTMYSVGLEASPQLVKGITDIYKLEQKEAKRGRRLVSQDDQKVLTKEEILTKYDITKAISDVWHSLEKSGFMDQFEILDYSDGEIEILQQQQMKGIDIDYYNPIHVYYQKEKPKGDQDRRTQKMGPRKIIKVVFYDPKAHKVLKEIICPNGIPEDQQIQSIKWYLKNKYLFVLDSKFFTAWLETRAVDTSCAAIYDVLQDAKHAYPDQDITGTYSVLIATRLAGEQLELPEFYYSVFSRLENKLMQRFTAINQQSIDFE